MILDSDVPCSVAQTAAVVQRESSMRTDLILVFIHSVYGQPRMPAVASVHTQSLRSPRTQRRGEAAIMGMCSHSHDSNDDPVFSLACYPKGDAEVHLLIERCPEMSHAETAVMARVLARSLDNLAAAEMLAQAEAN